MIETIVMPLAKTRKPARKKHAKSKPRAKEPHPGKLPQHTLSVPLTINEREQTILNAQFQAVGKLHNATLGTMLDRIEQMRRDSRWAEARLIADEKQRRAAYKALHEQYKVGRFEIGKVAHEHYQRSQWMSEVFGSRVVNGLAPEVWTSIASWLYQSKPGAGKPSFKPSTEHGIMHGNENKANLHLKIHQEVACVRVSSSTKRKTLLLALPRDWQVGRLNWQRKLATPLATGKVKRVSIKRETVRGRERYFAMIVIEGLPYRNPDYLADSLTVHGQHVGLDVGPSSLAVVGENASMLLDLYPAEVKSQRQAEQRIIKRQQRYLDRSLRALNPDSYDEHGRSIKGVRKTERSKKYESVQNKLRTAQRKRRIHKQQDHTAITRTVMRSVGTSVSSERNSYAGWQAGWFGKRMLETSPGALMNRLHGEACLLNAIHSKHGHGVSANGSYEFGTSSDCAPSQHCLCGHKQKKPLSMRHHACTKCGLGLPAPSTDLPLTDTSHRLDRDLFSALLARLTSENQEQAGNNILSNGPYAAWSRGDGNRARVRELTSARTPVTTPLLHPLVEGKDTTRILGRPNVLGQSMKPSNGSVVVETIGQTPEQHDSLPQPRVRPLIEDSLVVGRARTLVKAAEKPKTFKPKVENATHQDPRR